jgi:hypothetical protein
MRGADILINLGNKSVNQTPSKIFDYIGSCRPIVNLYSLDNDTSMHYLNSYPCKLNIKEEKNKVEENAELFAAFAEENAKAVIDEDAVKSSYSEYDSDAVTKDTLKIIFSCLNSVE